MKDYTAIQKTIFSLIEDYNLSLSDLKKLLRAGLAIPAYLVDDWANGRAEVDDAAEQKLYALRDNLRARGNNKKYMKQLREYISKISDAPRIINKKNYVVGKDYHSFERNEWLSSINAHSAV